MSDQIKELTYPIESSSKGVRIPVYVRPPADAEEKAREVCARTQCHIWDARAALDIAHWDVERAVENLQAISELRPRRFTWDDARDIAILVRDSLLMLIKGLERKFDLGKK